MPSINAGGARKTFPTVEQASLPVQTGTEACPTIMNIPADHAHVAEKYHLGFTLIELVVVLLVVAILSVFVAQKIGNVTEMKAAAFVKKLRADTRYAQNVAMTRNRRTRVYFNSAGIAPVFAPTEGYAVAADASAGACSLFAAVSDPAGSGNLTVTLAAGDYTGITVTPGSSSCLEFDSLGTPYNCSGNPGNCLGPAEGMTFTVNANAVAVGTITVTAGTGAVN